MQDKGCWRTFRLLHHILHVLFLHQLCGTGPGSLRLLATALLRHLRDVLVVALLGTVGGLALAALLGLSPISVGRLALLYNVSASFSTRSLDQEIPLEMKAQHRLLRRQPRELS